MTEATEAETQNKRVQADTVNGVTILTFGDARIEVSADGKRVDAYTGRNVVRKLAAAFKQTTGKWTHVDISEDFNKVVLKGITLERRTDGDFNLAAPRGTVVMMHALPAVEVAEVAAPKPPLKPGDRDEDGWILVCNLKDGAQLFLAPKDAGRMSLGRANRRAGRLQKKDKKAAHVPTGSELFDVYRSLAAIGGLEAVGLDPTAFYLSSRVRTAHHYPKSDRAYKAVESQRLSDGRWDTKGRLRAARQVRFVMVKPAL